MTAAETVADVLRMIEEKDLESARPFFSDDFTGEGFGPGPLDKRQFMGLMQGLTEAMADFSFNPVLAADSGDTVTVSLRIGGIHTAPLDLGIIGLPRVRPTGIEVALPQETAVFRFRAGKIAALQLCPVPGGGITGVLEQLGMERKVSV